MRWVAKAAVQKTLAALPAEERLNYLFQKHITRGLPRSGGGVAQHAEEAARHIATLRQFGSTTPDEARMYEFGAGWDLIGPLTLWSLGAEHQTVIDLRRNMHPELIAHTVATLPDHIEGAAAVAGVPGRPMPAGGPEGDPTAFLSERFGIDYLAPCDARASGLPDASFDLVSSTFVLEHVPTDDIAAILRESRRLLRRGGIVSCAIDFQDHYADFDPSVSVYNYLRFSDRAWGAVNSSLHFQNRLRLSDHLALFEIAGLEIVDVESAPVSAADREALADVKLARRFRSYDPEDLAVRTALVVARLPE